jgi:hypothetical protein
MTIAGFASRSACARTSTGVELGKALRIHGNQNEIEKPQEHGVLCQHKSNAQY